MNKILDETNNKIIIYQDENEVTRVSVRFAEEDLWLTQSQLAEIYSTTQENISMHITHIYKAIKMVNLSKMELIRNSY